VGGRGGGRPHAPPRWAEVMLELESPVRYLGRQVHGLLRTRVLGGLDGLGCRRDPSGRRTTQARDAVASRRG